MSNVGDFAALRSIALTRSALTAHFSHFNPIPSLLIATADADRSEVAGVEVECLACSELSRNGRLKVAVTAAVKVLLGSTKLRLLDKI